MNRKSFLRTLPATALLAAIMLSGCFLSPYRIDVQQGNYVTQDMLAKLKPGMSRSQVRFALGTPLLMDPFRTDRWDYVYTMQKGGEQVAQHVITVVFRGDQLDRIDGMADAPKAASAVSNGAPVPRTP